MVQQLEGFSADLDWAKNNGAKTECFNLAQQLMDFANYKMVNDYLNHSSQEALPLILVDGEFALAVLFLNRTELCMLV